MAFFFALAAGVFLGLKVISRKRISTESEFEARAFDRASLLGTGVAALLGILEPGKGRARATINELNQGHHRKKQEVGEGPVAGRAKD